MRQMRQKIGINNTGIYLLGEEVKELEEFWVR